MNSGEETNQSEGKIPASPKSATTPATAPISADDAALKEAAATATLQKSKEDSEAVQNIIAHMPAEIMDPFETVCNHFTLTLRQIFKLHGNISIHLDEKLLAHITKNKFSEWSKADKASFLTALLPRKRMNDILKPAATELLELARNDESSYVKLLSTMILSFVKEGSLSTNTITSHPALKKFEREFNAQFSTTDPITSLLPEQLLFLSAKVQKEVIPSGIKSVPAFTFKDDYTTPSVEDRYASYGVTKNDSPVPTPRSGTPPIPSGVSSRPRQPSSLFIPSGGASLNHPQAQKSAPIRGQVSARGFRKEGKVKMMELDEAEAAADMHKLAENSARAEKESLKAEKEAAREARLREAEEKRLKKQLADEERKAKAAERDVKKRKLSADQQGDSAQSSKQVRLDAEESNQQSNQASSVDDSHSALPSPFTPHSNNHVSAQANSALAATPVVLQSTSAVSSQVNSQLAQVLDGATELSHQDIEIISLFLQGQYATEKGKKQEFKLSERMYMDVDGVTRKRESLFIVLDYESCKWRKIKRTKKC